jgi:hypothetical protein
MGERLLRTLIELLAEQEGVTIKYEIERMIKHEEAQT